MTKHSHINQNIALVVDDDPDSLSMVSSALEEIGMTVIVAKSGQTAIDLVQRVSPDVILLDAIMPEMDGFETCRILKAEPVATNAPVIFMTGLTDAEDVVRGLGAGGVDYITKPLILDELIARIGIHILNSKLIQSARDALDTSGRSLLAFDRSGNLSWGSDQALSGFRSDGTLPDGMKEWLITTATRPVSQASPFEIADTQYVFLGLSPSDDILIKSVSARKESSQDILAQTLSLTLREAEVLYWLTMGKTNKDISTILSLSPRTVNKHLEQVFQKMGVDNRTSAAVTADRIIHSGN